MASLNGQTIASSYEQLLHTDTDGGGNGNTLVTIKDGDNGTTFGLKLATNKVKVIPSAANDANAFEVSQADGTAVFTVNSSTVGATLIGTLTVGADDAGHDVIFYGDTASSNMTWDTSADDLVLNDSRLFINQDDNSVSIDIDSEATTEPVIQVDSPASTTHPIINLTNLDSLTTGEGLRVHSNSSSNGTRSLVHIINDHASATNTIPLKIQQDSLNVAFAMDDPKCTADNVMQITNANALTGGGIMYLASNSSDTSTRYLSSVINDHSSATGTRCMILKQDAAQTVMFVDQGADGHGIDIDTEATVKSAIRIIDPKHTTGTVLEISDVDALTSGSAALFYSNSSSNTSRELVEIHNNNSNADNTVGLFIQQNGADASIELAGNGSIKFPGTQGASSDANSLDDYEEGLFDPTFVASGTDYDTVNYHADRAGSYTKVGNMVLCQITCRASSVVLGSASGLMLVGNLPFTSKARTGAGDDAEFTCHVHALGNFNSGKFPAGGYLSPNSTRVNLYYNTNGTSAPVALSYNHFDHSQDNRVIMTVMYRSAS